MILYYKDLALPMSNFVLFAVVLHARWNKYNSPGKKTRFYNDIHYMQVFNTLGERTETRLEFSNIYNVVIVKITHRNTLENSNLRPHFYSFIHINY